MLSYILIGGALFLAVNMGVSGFAVSFAPSYGSKVLSKTKAALFYAICVFAGSVLIGPRVVQTLTEKISLQQINIVSGFLVLLAAAAAMFLSNLLKIPQSTSFVTVASFTGAGLFYKTVNWFTIGKILFAAIVFSLMSFILTWVIKKKIYPPRLKNMKFYENFHLHRNKFKKFIIGTDMYAAFGIGTNNVANVVAPLVGSLGISPVICLALAAPFFGLGAYLSGERVLNTVSKDIVPLGEMSAVIVSFVTATFVIVCSLLGLPAPYVQFTTFSVLAISCVKDGAKTTFGKGLFRKIIIIWLLVPLATVFLSFGLHRLFLINF